MLTGFFFQRIPGFSMVAAPPLPPQKGDLKISGQNKWGGPEQKIKFVGKLNFRDGGGYEPQLCHGR